MAAVRVALAMAEQPEALVVPVVATVAPAAIPLRRRPTARPRHALAVARLGALPSFPGGSEVWKLPFGSGSAAPSF